MILIKFVDGIRSESDSEEPLLTNEAYNKYHKEGDWYCIHSKTQ